MVHSVYYYYYYQLRHIATCTFTCAHAAADYRQVSRANIKIADEEEGCSSRQVTITGTADCVDNALYLINAIQAKYSKN